MSASQPPAPVRADLDEVHQWLTRLFGGAEGLLHIGSTGVGPNGNWNGPKGNWTGDFFATTDDGIGAAVDYVRQIDAEGDRGIYARVTTLRERPATGRGGADLSLSFPGFWSDIDYGTIGHKHEVCPADCAKNHKHITMPLPPDATAARQIARESGLPEPTMIVDSGGGLYVWWLLENPHLVGADLADFTAMSSRWQRILKASANRLGWEYGEGVGNLDRILRIAGTVNRKAGLERACTLAESTGVVYPLDELATLLYSIDLPEPAAPAAPSKGYAGAPRGRNRDAAFTTPGGPGPFDGLDETADWRDLFEPHGCTFVRMEAGGTELWKWPGSSAESEYSFRCWPHVMVNHSESAPIPVGAGRKNTHGKVFAWLNHAGRTSDAGADLRAAAAGNPSASSAARGLRPEILERIRQLCNVTPWVDHPPKTSHAPAADRQTPKADTSSPEQADTGQADVRALMADAAESVILRGVFPTREALNAHPWANPDNSAQVAMSLPVFPVRTLPGDVGKFADAVATYAQVPVDAVAFAILGALGALVGGYATVNGQWREKNLNLYAVSLLDSGEGKSRAFGEITPSLYALERELRAKWDAKYGDNAEQLEVAQGTRDKIIKDLASARGDKRRTLLADLDSVKATIKELTGPSRPQLLVGDATPEALAQVMHRQGGHIGHISAEGSMLSIALGRYSKGEPNIELLLVAFDSSEPHRPVRTTRETPEIERPSLSISLSVQPIVIEEAMSSTAVTERGLLNRFLFTRPESMAGRRDSAPPRIPNYLAEAWDRCVRNAYYGVLPDGEKYDAEGELKPPTAMQISDTAEATHLEWRRGLELRVDPDTGDLASMKGWIGRIGGAAYRLAALLHLAAGHKPNTVIHEHTMADAIAIADYCIPHAVAILGNRPQRLEQAGDEPAAHVLGWIRRKGVAEFTVEDARRGVRGRAWCKQQGAQGVRTVLVRLAAQGWLATIARLDEQGRQMPDALFVSHPELLRSVS